MSKYGATPEQYKEIFATKAKEHIHLLQELERVCRDAGTDLWSFDSRFIWNFFQGVIYEADEEARITQKKNDPEGYKSESFLGETLYPSREDLMNELKNIKALLESKE
jgi:hypothetical protein